MRHTRIAAVGVSVALGLVGCGSKSEPADGNSGPAKADSGTVGLPKQDVSGQAQKGPFATGTRVNIAELDDQLVQTGRSFATTLKDDKGSFTVRGVKLGSPYARVEIDGYYFDEVKGQLSDNRLALFAYIDLSDQATANVNILGHLEAARLEHLVASEHINFAAAQAQAHAEVLSVFQFDPGKVGPAAGLDISQSGAGNAALFAISIILQGERSVGELSELLANIQNDLSEDGTLDDPELVMTLKESAMTVDVDAARNNLAGQFEGLGVAANVPDAAEGVSSFVDSSKEGDDGGAGGVRPTGADAGASASGAAVGVGSAKPPMIASAAGSVHEPVDGGAPISTGAAGSAADAGGPRPGEPEEACTVATCPCVDTWKGNFEVVSASDMAALECVREITGSLTFHQTCTVDDVELLNLETVTGDVYFHQTNVRHVSMPALSSIGGFLYFHQNTSLLDVSMDSLEQTGQYLYFHSNCSLNSVSLPLLSSVGGAAADENAYLYVTGNASLASLDLPRLSHVASYIYVGSNCALEQLSWAALDTVAGDYVYVDNNALDSTSIQALSEQLVEIGFTGENQLRSGQICEPDKSCSQLMPFCAL